jgi:hypothetical protein
MTIRFQRMAVVLAAIVLLLTAMLGRAEPGSSVGSTGTRSTRKVESPGGFVVETLSSRVYAKVGAQGYGRVHGISGKLLSGKVDLNGSGELVFEMKSFAADPPEARRHLALPHDISHSDQKKITANMLGSDVLDAANHPKAVYAINAATPLDGQASGELGRYQLDGKFTLRGVTRTQRLIVLVERADTPGDLLMRGGFAIVQSSFGITPYSALGGFVRVSDKVEIIGEIILHPASP